jgi:O-antigen/teichoic acid export membrane protein
VSELVTRARKAAAWSVTDVLLRQIVQLASSIVLARLLVPEDFGVLALVSLVVFLAGTLAEGGLAQALIQKRDVRPEDVSSVFWFSLVVSSVLAVGLTAGSDLIAAASGNPGTAPLIAFMSLALVFNGAHNVHRAMLTKALKFRILSIASVGAAVVSGLIAVLLALAGYGAWSLAWQAVIAAAVTCAALMWSYALPRPLVFEWAGLKDLLRFGSWLVLGGFLNALRGGFATLLLARLFSLRDLGLYSRAEGTMNIPNGLLSSSSERVIRPVLTRCGAPPRMTPAARRWRPAGRATLSAFSGAVGPC